VPTYCGSAKPVDSAAGCPIDREREYIGPVVVPNRIKVLKLSAQPSEAKFSGENFLVQAAREEKPVA